MLRSFSQQDSGIFLKMNFSNGLHDGAQQILRLPLPTIPISNMSRKTSTSSISSSKNHSGGSTESIGDGTSEDGKIMRMGQMMDFWTAASLNADGIPVKVKILLTSPLTLTRREISMAPNCYQYWGEVFNRPVARKKFFEFRGGGTKFFSLKNDTSLSFLFR